MYACIHMRVLREMELATSGWTLSRILPFKFNVRDSNRIFTLLKLIYTIKMSTNQKSRVLKVLPMQQLGTNQRPK